MTLFARPPKSWWEILALIYRVPLGRQSLGRLYDFSKQYRIHIVSYPSELRVKLSDISKGKPVGASFVTDGQSGTLYVDLRSDLGIVVPFLFHEMIHCMDLSLWKGAAYPLSRAQRRDLVFESECKAYNAQYLFQNELKEVFPELKAYYLNRHPDVPILHRSLLPHEIAELYGPIHI